MEVEQERLGDQAVREFLRLVAGVGVEPAQRLVEFAVAKVPPDGLTATVQEGDVPHARRRDALGGGVERVALPVDADERRRGARRRHGRQKGASLQPNLNDDPPHGRQTHAGTEKVAPPASLRGFPAVAEGKVWELEQSIGENAAPARRG